MKRSASSKPPSESKKRSAPADAQAALERWQALVEASGAVRVSEYGTPMEKGRALRGPWLLTIRESRDCPTSCLSFGRSVELADPQTKKWSLEVYRRVYDRATPLCYAADYHTHLHPGQEDARVLREAGVQFSVRYDPQQPDFRGIEEAARYLWHEGCEYRFAGCVALECNLPGHPSVDYNPAAPAFAAMAPKPRNKDELLAQIARLRALLDVAVQVLENNDR